MKREEFNQKKFLPFLLKQGIIPEEIDRIRAGRNNRVWCISENKSCWALKEYFQHPQDPRDRLKAESSFLNFINRYNKNLPVPEVVAVDHEKNLGLYTWMNGKPVKKINQKHLEQCVSFIAQFNKDLSKKAKDELSLASEACTAIQQHLESIKSRVDQIFEIKATTSIHQKALRWVKNNLKPKLEKILLSRIKTELEEINLLPNYKLILSPSDFGFHNILEQQDKLYFYDFEYAGWDDPSKLCADFACQPQQQITKKQGSWFCQNLEKQLGWQGLIKKFQLLLPLYRIKWCCIMLNEFRDVDLARRSHAVEQNQEQRLKLQLKKVCEYYNEHLGESASDY